MRLWIKITWTPTRMITVAGESVMTSNRSKERTRAGDNCTELQKTGAIENLQRSHRYCLQVSIGCLSVTWLCVALWKWAANSDAFLIFFSGRGLRFFSSTHYWMRGDKRIFGSSHEDYLVIPVDDGGSINVQIGPVMKSPSCQGRFNNIRCL